MVELLSPAQDFVSLRAAIDAGADAVYFGIQSFNMRAGAKNFELKDLKKITALCHKSGVEAFLVLNTMVYDNEISKVKKILDKAKSSEIDGIIAWDFAVISQADKLNIPIRLSTQTSVANFEALKVLKNTYKNIKTVVLARELTLEQIKKIIRQIKKEQIDVQIETFIHGAMCVSVSGRCFLSQEIFGASANRGECYQPCRRKYIIKDCEEDFEFELGEEFVLSPNDLCTLPFIGKLVGAGISSFKIEGRNKSPEYVKTVTEVYREAIDNPKADKIALMNKLKSVYNRGFSSGFYMGRPVNEWTKAEGNRATRKKVYVGVITNFYKTHNVAEILVEAHEIKVGDTLLIQGNKSGVFEQEIESMQVEHERVDKLKKGLVGIKFDRRARTNDKVFLIKKI